jgi:hypothetical protein
MTEPKVAFRSFTNSPKNQTVKKGTKKILQITNMMKHEKQNCKKEQKLLHTNNSAIIRNARLCSPHKTTTQVEKCRVIRVTN